jgi:hypothetical protein
LEYSGSFYVAFSAEGCLVTGIETNDLSPFSSLPVAHIAKYSNPGILDLRLFIDHMDYKAIGDITVANDQRFGHFTDIKAAVDYSREFSKMFPEMSAPSILIKEGTFEVSETINLDFDIKVSGSGPGTVIKRADSFAPMIANLYSLGYNIFEIGVSKELSNITNGVFLGGFSYYGISGSIGSAAVINIRHDTDHPGQSLSAMIELSNICFLGADDYNFTEDPTTSVPNEFPVVIGTALYPTVGEVKIGGCMFDRMGYKKGQIGLFSYGNYKNINVIGNISVRTIDSAYSIIDDSLLGGGTVTGVQEVGNVIEYVP